jgi:hypothetical protein
MLTAIRLGNIKRLELSGAQGFEFDVGLAQEPNRVNRVNDDVYGGRGARRSRAAR